MKINFEGVKRKYRKLINKIYEEALIVTENKIDNLWVSVSFENEENIKKLNNSFRKVDKSTDVLSFPLGENGEYDINPENGAYMLGDIVISFEHAEAQANLYGHSFERELAFLTVHSMLHLLGYDHVNGGMEQAIMREKEEAILDLLGLAINKV